MELNFKDKSKLNLSIDITMLLLIMPIAGIGFLIKYVLIPGVQRNILYGNNVDLEFWGLTRHQWGIIHLTLCIIFLGLLILHIIFHWKMIVCILQRMIPDKSLRIAVASLITTISLLTISFPLFVKPIIVEREPLHKNRHDRNNNAYSGFPETQSQEKYIDTVVTNNNNRNRQNYHSVNDEYEVYGSQTLQFVADKYNVPANKIAADLKIPETLTGEKLGRLKKKYSFTMDDIKNSISNYKKGTK